MFIRSSDTTPTWGREKETHHGLDKPRLPNWRIMAADLHLSLAIHPCQTVKVLQPLPQRQDEVQGSEDDDDDKDKVLPDGDAAR